MNSIKITETQVLFEDNHLIAINKPAGILVQADKTGDRALNELCKDFLKAKYNKPGNVYLGTLHRLDRPVSGIVLFAKTSKAADRMSKAFQTKKIDKEYWCLTNGSGFSKKGKIQTYIKKDSRLNQSTSFKNEVNNSKLAITEFELLSKQQNYSLLKLKPITGRSHQLRVHMAQDIGAPILADVKYGSTYSTKNRSLYLHSKRMSFTHPTTKIIIRIEAPLPKDKIWDIFSNV